MYFEGGEAATAESHATDCYPGYTAHELRGIGRYCPVQCPHRTISRDISRYYQGSSNPSPGLYSEHHVMGGETAGRQGVFVGIDQDRAGSFEE